MSRQVRQRVTAIVLGGLIFGVPMLAIGSARADPIPEGDRAVTFSGNGMFSVSCSSRPSTESMTVPAESTIRVVNQTGYAAELLLGGDTRGTVPDDSSTDVIFRRGTTSVALRPNCAIGDDPTPMMVTASPSASAAGPADSDQARPSSADATPMSLAPDDDDRSPAGSSAPDVAPPAQRPSRVRPATTRPDPPRQPSQHTHSSGQATTTAAQAMPHGTAATTPKAKTKSLPSTAGSAAPAFAGMPPGDTPTLLPGVPNLDLDPVTVGTEPPAPAPVPTVIAAAEPVAALEPMREGNPLGLLALTAAVCVVGVTVAAIRAFVSQRANRAEIA
ncbi:hypothetical protein M1L60_32305 [Actinoplanes sp. TRM 88003]|uniref:Uncharacterized protein n=1 Tax=Paractinoplanes aksuensis TaxID=2939490 RepID=A0ABT1DZD7_9ACTN|nr:hypothetical protein [Actinoplanes aksuensis]MCO8275275.1 hypothetical protein [Actinoplanes aksuensis]